MDDYQTPKPIFEGRDLTPLLTSTGQHSGPKRKKNVPAAIGRIVGELGLRFRPPVAADLEAHALRLKLLAEDVADLPAHLLEAAVTAWVRDNNFLPKAAELVALARATVSQQSRGTNFALNQLDDHCADLNRKMPNSGNPWIVAGKAPHRFVTREAEAPAAA
jgi:hypothetical protein